LHLEILLAFQRALATPSSHSEDDPERGHDEERAADECSRTEIASKLLSAHPLPGAGCLRRQIAPQAAQLFRHARALLT
jgi:hypothetical protein